MANLSAWQPGMKEIILLDFETSEPVSISLEPEKNAVQNAQKLYKQVGKLKRARGAVEPLLHDVQAEIDYLEQVEAALLTVQLAMASTATLAPPAGTIVVEAVNDTVFG